MEEYLQAMQKMQKHKGFKVFVVFEDRGGRTSSYGKVVEVMSRMLIMETIPGGMLTESVHYESIVFILDRTGKKIFTAKDLGPGTQM